MGRFWERTFRAQNARDCFLPASRADLTKQTSNLLDAGKIKFTPFRLSRYELHRLWKLLPKALGCKRISRSYEPQQH